MTGYLSATRHPWSTLLFIFPLLLTYELGVIALSKDNPDTLRNGADVWMRDALAQYGLPVLWAAPVVIFVILLVGALWNRSTRPKEPLSTIFGMTIESLIYSVGIWALSRNFRPLLEQAGITQLNIHFQNLAMGQIVNYLGAGIYEEMIFRFGLFSILFALLRLVLFPALLTMTISAIISSLIFSAAHHVGSAGEPLVPVVFLFRTIVGLIFTLIFVTRGLGIAVGAHAGYNILVGPTVG